LYFDDKPLLEAKAGEISLYGPSFQQPMGTFPVDSTFSAVSLVSTEGMFDLITWFKLALSQITVLQITPPMMEEVSMKESRRPSRYFENFISWYRWISQDQGMVIRLQRELKEIIRGFDHLNLESEGRDARNLNALFSDKGIRLRFGSLSDGQRMLVALYAAIHGLTSRLQEFDRNIDLPPGLLCLDEPDNFIATAEIQPWLTSAEDRLLETGSRLMMISHHPESIDYGLMPSSGHTYSAFWFSREEAGRTRVQPIAPEQPGGLKPSELAARGWLTS
jgi:hypothetical protein